MARARPTLRGRLWQAGVRVEAAGALLLAALLVHVLPFRLTARLFGAMRPADATAEAREPHPAADRARWVGRRVAWLAGRLPWDSSCLVQAVALGLLLARRGIGGWSIRFGVSRSGGPLMAHAWMLLGPEILIGAAEAARHAPLADLGRSDAPRPR